jgi:hypothetical protein
MNLPNPNFPGLADAPRWLVKIVEHYETLKQATAASIGVNDWLLHVNGGMLIMVLVATIFRRSLTSLWPLIAVITAEAINEYFDKLAFGSWRWGDTRLDIFFTLLWPALLLVFLRTGLIKRG